MINEEQIQGLSENDPDTFRDAMRKLKSSKRKLNNLTIDEQVEMAEQDVLAAMDYVEELKKRKEENVSITK